jgi:hypothetical protein
MGLCTQMLTMRFRPSGEWGSIPLDGGIEGKLTQLDKITSRSKVHFSQSSSRPQESRRQTRRSLRTARSRVHESSESCENGKQIWHSRDHRSGRYKIFGLYVVEAYVSRHPLQGPVIQFLQLLML